MDTSPFKIEFYSVEDGIESLTAMDESIKVL
jgi:hypothetical protein